MSAENLCVKCGEDLPFGARECECGWRAKAPKFAKGASTQCSELIGGEPCSIPASMGEDGKLYCPAHWMHRRGMRLRESNSPRTSYRERWYLEARLPYEPPSRGNLGGILPRLREPGDDDEEVAA